MANELPDIESFLPYGNSLRELVSQSYISAFELKRTLRQRGIFLNYSDKETSIPVLMSLLLSPQEFETLREKQNTKEDNIKTSSFTLEIPKEKMEHVDLISLLPDSLDLNTLIHKENTRMNYSVDGQPNFHLSENKNPNKIEMPFTTTRDNLTKDWATNKTKHEGSVIIEKIVEGDKILIKVTEKITSTETRDVCKEFSKSFEKHLKDQNIISQEVEPRKILFNDFSNENRILFLQKIMADVKNSDLLELKDITDIELSPDRSSQMPDKLGFLQEKIEQIKLKGKDLFNSFFVQEKTNHKFLYFSGIEAKYKFTHLNVSGNCSILFTFNGFSKNQDVWSELEIRVNSLVFDKGCKDAKKNFYQSKILDYFEKTKFNVYETFKIKAEELVQSS
ncbi:MAG: hypothetical protein K0R24_1719 [Gammaproteobacteria bacterium]|jgi:hypothetical protein|nr:hypothetical protein [Gammaproteobacteria bacterium]